MENFKNIIEEAREYAISEIDKYGPPPLVLFEIAEKKAIELAKQRTAIEQRRTLLENQWLEMMHKSEN